MGGLAIPWWSKSFSDLSLSRHIPPSTVILCHTPPSGWTTAHCGLETSGMVVVVVGSSSTSVRATQQQRQNSLTGEAVVDVGSLSTVDGWILVYGSSSTSWLTMWRRINLLLVAGLPVREYAPFLTSRNVSYHIDTSLSHWSLIVCGRKHHTGGTPSRAIIPSGSTGRAGHNAARDSMSFYRICSTSIRLAQTSHIIRFRQQSSH